MRPASPANDVRRCALAGLLPARCPRFAGSIQVGTRRRGKFVVLRSVSAGPLVGIDVTNNHRESAAAVSPSGSPPHPVRPCGVIARFGDLVSHADAGEVVSLGEGSTPLLHARYLSDVTGCTVYLKVEGANPTGSFKDRGMTTAVTAARSRGDRLLLCASTGNTAASAAAYAAQAGLDCAVLIPQGRIASGKLAQAHILGARIVQIDGNFDDCLTVARSLAETFPTVGLVNSINPDRIAGQKSAAYEICDTLSQSPQVHILPVGNAGNIHAHWLGYSDYLAEGIIDSRPRMLGVQAAGAAPLVTGSVVENPDTIATAIRIGSPASWQAALRVQSESNGMFCAATDAEILDGYRLVARAEGIFVEPSSAASIAGLVQAVQNGWIEPGSLVVCSVTGNGLKDPEVALSSMSESVAVVADPEAVASALTLT